MNPDKIYSDLRDYWELDFKNLQITRKKSTNICGKILSFFWKKKHSVQQLYWWIKLTFHKNENGAMAFSFPLEHDNFPVNGFPMKYRLKDGWTIDKSDLKYLINGPLTTEDFKIILVRDSIGWNKKFMLLWNSYRNIVTPIGATIAIFSIDWQIFFNYILHILNSK